MPRKYASLSTYRLLGFDTLVAVPEHSHKRASEDSGKMLKSSYTIRGEEEVMQFVEVHKYLLPLLKAAPKHINQYFDSESPILEVFTDPDDDIRKLVIVIPTTLDARKARTQLDRIRTEWWRKISRNLDPENNLHLSLEFK